MSIDLTTIGALRALFAPSQLGPRTRGSTTDRGLDAVPADRKAVEFLPPLSARFGAARYFEVYAPELNGRVGAIRLGNITSAGRTILKRRAAPEGHGDELYLDRPESVTVSIPDSFITVIIGPDSEPPAGKGVTHLVGYTWHPGQPLAPLAPGAEPTDDTAVKRHNGT